MTGYSAGNKGGMSTKYSIGNSTSKTAAPSIKVGYSDGKKSGTRREGDPKSSHGK